MSNDNTNSEDVAGDRPDAICSPVWISTILKGAAHLKAGMETLQGGPLDFYLEKMAGSVEYLLTRFSPFKVGDLVELTETPEISDTVSWGWLGAKHYMVAGATGRVASVDCDRSGLSYSVVMDNQTYIFEGRKHPVSTPKSFAFRERWLRLANTQPQPPPL